MKRSTLAGRDMEYKQLDDGSHKKENRELDQLAQNVAIAPSKPSITISVPPETMVHLEELKAFFNEKSASSIMALGIEILYWIKNQHAEGFSIQAEKEVGNKILIKEIPIALIHNKSK